MRQSDYKFSLEIVSDTICPWCYIGKKKLNAALALIGDDINFDINWRPFELNPEMPREGLDRKAYRSAKFGSWEKSRVLDAQVQTAGETVGLDFHHERMTMTPNTLASHVLVRLSLEMKQQDAVVEAIFEAYFTEGRDIGHPEVLTDIGVSCGLDRDEIIEALSDADLRQAVKTEATAFANAGISGVPTLLLNRHVLVSGAQPPEFIANSLRKAVQNQNIIDAGTGIAADG